MLSRLRSTLMAWGGALILAVSASGLVAAASLVGDTTPTTDGTVTTPAVTDTSATFQDLNGDGIDDDCQDAVVADQTAADAAVKAADTNGDGTISVSEAAHTDWIGGANCNHGGYVSTVAHASGDDCAAETLDGSDEGTDAGAPAGTTLVKAEGDEGDQSDCSSDSQQATTTQDETPPAECQATTPAAPTTTSDQQTPEDTSPNAHGKAVSEVARTPGLVGGKNCNHGGAVSEAAKKDHGTDVHGNSAKHAGGKAPKQPKSKGHGSGHANP